MLTPWKTGARMAGAGAAMSMLIGCTGQPTSTSSWQSAADRAIGQAVAALGTARIALRVETEDRGPHTYSVVTVTDAVETSGKAASGFQTSQPPDALHRANEAVNQALGDAVSLLVRIRVELASPGIDAAAGKQLMAQVDVQRKQLDDLDKAVKTSPASVGRRS
jgi:hypothetical protein